MRIGIVGDPHFPFEHVNYMRFCLDLFDQWDVDRVHFIGDIVDGCAVSVYEIDPDGLSASTEAEYAAVSVAKWHKQFPGCRVSIGNHDLRIVTAAKRAGLPACYLKDYKDIWNTPTWRWELETEIDGCLYTHGTGGGAGQDAAYRTAMSNRCSTIIGHYHAFPGVKYQANPNSRIFGLNVGCGVDIKAYSQAYGKHFKNRPVLGAGIVVDGDQAYFEVMKCGRGEQFHWSKAPKKERDKPWSRM